MANKERGIVFTNDLDGVHFRAPPPKTTLMQLLRNEFTVPEEGREVEVYSPREGLRGALSSRWSVFFHQIRPVNREALEGLALFQQAADTHDRQLNFAALSGREVDKHLMTQIRLEKAGYTKYFTKFYLNEGKSASAWKESIVRSLLDGDLNVVHLDDDFRAGLCIARLSNYYPDQRVLVYMMRNISNHPKLLERARVEIPDNLVFVRSVAEAAGDFTHRLEKRSI